MATVYSAGDFRNGTTFEMDGVVYRIVEFQHVKPGKGSAFVRTKIKNVITGSVLEKTFNPSDKFPAAEVEKKEMQYLYNDGDLYYFMDNNTYEQTPLNSDQIGDSLKFLKENMDCKLLSIKGKVFAIELPISVELTVEYTEPGLQEKATPTYPVSAEVVSLMESNPNILNTAKTELFNRYNDAYADQRTNHINPNLSVESEQAASSVEAGIQDENTKVQAARADYVSSLEGAVTTSE